MELNKIHNENCLDTMSRMLDDFVDLTVTSPPYDNLREYKGYSFDFENIAKELYRVTKEGGVVVWVVNDATINGSETATSFKQALYFKEIGFKLHDTMIWHKTNAMPNISKKRYTPSFEYMFIFSKGQPKVCNRITENCKYAGKTIQTYTTNKESIMGYKNRKETKKVKPLHNIWSIKVFGTNYGHPAIFPEKLAKDHIISWSNENDLVYDCFMGSGTTAKMCILNNRKYIGSEISKEYVDIANKRLIKYKTQNKLF
ncbi:MAG: site-specific DNA-methyltransferase [Methanobacteriota archaeon]|nr:MAG: site-specific DNA-methyltransferase [Euryarchaeota archaeon]|tara:strand:+ start:5336 stop:6106 length:771 start_codon:yes stop_codon:yes gene_type:complete